jgi:biopolymer transport protein ExbD
MSTLDETMDFPRTRRRLRQLGLIPLIDVAMFLLIFFMVAGTLEKFELLPIDPPLAESGKLMDEGHIMILLGARDEVVVDDELTNVEALEQYIRKSLGSNPNKVITVKADATIPAVRMIQVMDRIRAAGGKNLSIVTQASTLNAARR